MQQSKNTAEHFRDKPFDMDILTDSIRDRIYEAMKTNVFTRTGRSFYAAIRVFTR